MLSLFMVAILFTANPTVDSLIQNLASESYDVRSSSARQLIEIGYPALDKLRVAKDSEDMDVSRAAHMILRRYYEPVRWTHESIWYLPKRFRYVNGEDIAHKYYKRAVAKKKTTGIHVTENYYCYDDAEMEATQFLYTDLLNSGNDKLVYEIDDAMHYMGRVADVMYKVNYAKMLGNPYDVPKPIEDIIVLAHGEWSDRLHGTAQPKVTTTEPPEPDDD